MPHLAPDIPGEIRKLRWMIGRLLPVRDLTCHTRNGTLTFSSHAGIIARRLFSRRQWSWELIQRCQQLLYEEGFLRQDCQGGNGTLINVGAHIGSVYVPMMQECRFTSGLAFEPSRRNYAYLKRNVEQNNLDSITRTLPVGLSNENRKAEFELSVDNCGDNRVRNVETPGGGACYGETNREVITIELRKLDDVLDELSLVPPKSSLIWVDVQGHEGHFFQGAADTIRRGIPVVTEFWPYGIERSGMGRHSYLNIADELFSGFFYWRKRQWVQLPIDALADLYKKFEHGHSGTDVVLVPRCS